MNKPLTISAVMFASILVFSGCTKTTGNSVSTINPSINVEVPTGTDTTTTQSADVPELLPNNTLDDLEKDLNNTSFSDVDIEIDSSL
jgi:hypothetical protein